MRSANVVSTLFNDDTANAAASSNPIQKPAFVAIEPDRFHHILKDTQEFVLSRKRVALCRCCGGGREQQRVLSAVIDRTVGNLLAGLPVSTTQVLCGALLGVGLFEGAKGVNWKQSAKVGSSYKSSASPALDMQACEVTQAADIVAPLYASSMTHSTVKF